MLCALSGVSAATRDTRYPTLAPRCGAIGVSTPPPAANMNAVLGCGCAKSPSDTSCDVTSSPTIGVAPGNVPAEYVNCALGVSRAKPAPPNTYGETRVDVGIVHRRPPIEYQAGTRALPTTESPSAESAASVASTAGCSCDGCRLWNCPRSANRNRFGAIRAPASPTTSPDVPSGATANPPAAPT